MSVLSLSYHYVLFSLSKITKTKITRILSEIRNDIFTYPCLKKENN